ncbi:MAG: cyclic nucleotide-binding/CBS domain-containing protein [Thermoplasmata archaeon]|nr:CBS domain-containing protein [Thermoplasmata archaeon]
MGKIKVSEVMSKNPLIMDISTKLIDAVKTMVDRGISTIIVSEHSKPVGIVTDRDIIVKVVARNLDPNLINLGEIMSSPLMIISVDEDLEKAAYIMSKKKIRKLPVLEKNRIMGILSENDIVKIAPDLLAIAENKSTEEDNEKYFEEEHFAGKCEICGQFSTELTYFKGQLVCPECKSSM